MAPFPGIQQALPGATETIGASEKKNAGFEASEMEVLDGLILRKWG